MDVAQCSYALTSLFFLFGLDGGKKKASFLYSFMVLEMVFNRHVENEAFWKGGKHERLGAMRWLCKSGAK